MPRHFTGGEYRFENAHLIDDVGFAWGFTVEIAENGSESRSGDESDPADGAETVGSESDAEIWLDSTRGEDVTLAVDATADGETVVSDTFTLEEPSAISRREVAGTVPKGTNRVAIAVDPIGWENTAETESFDLPSTIRSIGFGSV